MHGPDGTDYPNEAVFVQVVRPERLAYDHAQPPFQVVVTLSEVGKRTELTMRMSFPSPEERERAVSKYKADAGMKETIGRLGEQLKKMTGERDGARKPPAKRELVITRIFNAPRERVWKAWTDPEQVKRWWGPKAFTSPYCK